MPCGNEDLGRSGHPSSCPSGGSGQSSASQESWLCYLLAGGLLLPPDLCVRGRAVPTSQSWEEYELTDGKLVHRRVAHSERSINASLQDHDSASDERYPEVPLLDTSNTKSKLLG